MHKVEITHLSMEQRMLLRTLVDKRKPMSAFELTNHWQPTWSVQEVVGFMQGLVQAGHVSTQGKDAKTYFLSKTASKTIEVAK